MDRDLGEDIMRSNMKTLGIDRGEFERQLDIVRNRRSWQARAGGTFETRCGWSPGQPTLRAVSGNIFYILAVSRATLKES
jgi:hypothetical protein